ncbi:putative GTPase [Saccharomycopsis crataegensis]|uniref:GTPase n=1 Tax=Saccharomycopsis crataegensis TaxID=43959 RepID=A0AAV5QRG1_9ASCO|nr:putative GTPase [Saccharomycopsis crataegensis]
MSSVSRKLAIVGARAVGKSSLTLRFTESRFDDSYYPTIENQYMKSFKVNGKVYDVDISDTAGQDEYSIVNQRQLIGIHGFLLVYSIASRSSFEVLSTIRDKILNILSFGEDTKVPFVVVANKTDLGSGVRQVSKEEGLALAREFNCPFIEVSAKDNTNVDRAFEILLQHIEELTNPQEKKEAGCVIV